jgi:TRAP-type C4-dicarboxylate transport system substrate-binding protein
MLWLAVALVALASGCTQPADDATPADATSGDEAPAVNPPAAPEAAEADEPEPQAAADPAITLTYANFPPAPTFPCVQMERWAEVVAERTNGQVDVQTFPGSTLLGAKNMYDGVVSGVADIGCLAMSYQPGRFPVSEAVDLPLGFTSATAASLTLYEVIEEFQPEEFAEVKVLTLFTCPPCNFMTREPVLSLADLDGLELRCSGTGVNVIELLGGTPVAMPQSETPDAIQKGIVKGIVSSLEILKDFNFAAYTPHVTREDLFVVTFAVVMNQDRWDSLPADVRETLDGLSKEHAQWTGEYVDGHVEEALAWAKDEYGLEIHRFSPEERAEIEQRLEPMADEYVARMKERGLPGEQILASVRTHKANFEGRFGRRDDAGAAAETAESPDAP